MPENSEDVLRIKNDYVYKRAVNQQVRPAQERPKATVSSNSEKTSDSDSPAFSGPTPINQKLRIKFNCPPDSPKYQRLLNLLVYFNGNTPVEVEFPDKSLLQLKPACYVELDAKVISIIGQQVGIDNIKIIGN